MTCATKGCNFGVFRDGLCAPCYHRAEQQREDLIRRKARAFDKIEARFGELEVVLKWPRGMSFLDAVEAMEERG